MKSKKYQLIFILLAGFFLTITVKAQNCKYDKNGFRDFPLGHILSKEDIGRVSQIKGKVFDFNNQELNDVKITLYRIENESRVFIGSQISDKNGNFCFKGLSRGKYELKMGGISGFNSTLLILELIPKNKKLINKIQSFLQVGT